MPLKNDEHESSEEEHDLEELEEGEGYELKEIGRDEQNAATSSGAERYDSDNDSQEEDEDGDHALLRRRTFTYTPMEEATVKRKLDRNLVVFVAFLYMLSFLDRGNLGNAKLANLTTDLQITHFSRLITAFYIPYILFQPLSHLYTYLPAHKHLTCIVLSWGIIASLQSLCTTATPLIILRFLLGVSEAAFAGIPIYLSFFFRPEELAFRLGIFIAAAPLASSFAGTLAAVILAIGDHIPIANWRLLFLVEGFPAVLVSMLVWSWVPDTPSSASWLTARERKIAHRRLNKQPPQEKSGINWKGTLRPLLSLKSYLIASVFFAVNVSFASIPVFLPTILSHMSFSPLASQILTAPPYLLSVVTILITAYLSDRHRTRSIPLFIHSSLAFLGFLILSTANRTGLPALARYAAIFPITSGLFSCVAGIITWMVGNEKSSESKGTGFAVLQMAGQVGSLVGAGMFPDEEGPFFGRGFAFCAGCMFWVGVGTGLLRVLLGRGNRSLREGEKFML